MSKITREQAIAYLDQLGDPVDWSGWTLEQIREEVLKGDSFDGMSVWSNMLLSLNAQDI